MNGNPASLILRHSDISTTTTTQTIDNAVGGWSNYKQTTYWYVNLKTLLNEDWDKYDKFCIRLNQVNFANAGAYPTGTSTDINWVSYMSGLNWVNSSYNVATNTNTNRAPLGLFIVQASANTAFSFNQHNLTNFFRKGDNFVKIQIEHFRVTDGQPVATTIGLPHTVWSFDVFGVANK